jgi:hypothetical protein
MQYSNQKKDNQYFEWRLINLEIWKIICFLIEPQTLECKVKTLIVDFMLMLYHPKTCPHCKYAKWTIIVANLKALKTIASYWILGIKVVGTTCFPIP